MAKLRVAAYIDGFNLYHAIHDLNRAHLKWVDLWQLMECFIDPAVHEIVAVHYFSAYATWLPKPHKRHQSYVAALRSSGITPIMAKFKEKERSCFTCGAAWTGHEEKESDVNIAVQIIEDAMDDKFDHAFLVTGDSDLAAPIRCLRRRFPKKRLKLIAPPHRRHSKELWALATHRKSIKIGHLESSLFPAAIVDSSTGTTIKRPPPYDPP